MASFVVSVVGVDRPGIVAAVTGALYEHGANVEDTSMSILRGHFAMTLVVVAPGLVSEVEAALAGVAASWELLVGVREITGDVETRPAAAPYVVGVYGSDRPGIVARVTSLLAESGVNVTDLTTRLQGAAGEETYVMLMEVDVPPGVDVPSLSRALSSAAEELGVEATLHESEADLL